ncbi:hypothetical protein NE237_015651 [Protea cynaroides]|uniref:Uncharacterized protein n=1 Tax=Protea cynaroides TaxID=273540 RepID=A0A9Q0QR51_9MAGN|nr:hypothetical protein NE237_015651 [Protea cynaroides]
MKACIVCVVLISLLFLDSHPVEATTREIYACTFLGRRDPRCDKSGRVNDKPKADIPANPYTRGIPILKASGDSMIVSKYSSCDFSCNLSFDSQRRIKLCDNRRFGKRIGYNDKRLNQTVLIVAASAESSHCENRIAVTWPLQPRSSAGEILSDVLQDEWDLFDFTVASQLNKLVADRDGAIARKQHSEGSAESSLHRRIAEIKERECQIAVEDVMYMQIVHKFTEIKVPMVPRISKCINNGRLELGWPKDKELKTIYSIEVRDMVEEHVTILLGWRGRPNVAENWINYTTTQMKRVQLGQVYIASIMFGYFLKSACLRLNMDKCLKLSNHKHPKEGRGNHNPIAKSQNQRLKNPDTFSHSTDTWARSSRQLTGMIDSRKHEKLRYYIMGFDPETFQKCARQKSQEAVNLIDKHSSALFGYEMGKDYYEAIDVSYYSLERLVLEAVAFGSFLWDVEEYVDSIYRLKENIPRE